MTINFIKKKIFIINNQNKIIIFLLIFVIILLLSLKLSPGKDWDVFYSASKLLFEGKSPYNYETFGNPPWSLIISIPLVIVFPKKIAGDIWFVIGIFFFAITAYRLHAKPIAMGLFLIAPPTVHCLLNGNINWLPLFGFTLPPYIGLLFILIKPQIGIGLAIYWIINAYKSGGFIKVIKIIFPTLIAYILSFVLYGFWIKNMLNIYKVSMLWNTSLWPYSVPLGLLLIIFGIKKKDPTWVYGAGPFLSPYVLFHVWDAVLVSLLRKTWILFFIVILLWIIVFYKL